jgi:hypothetical protein
MRLVLYKVLTDCKIQSFYEYELELKKDDIILELNGGFYINYYLCDFRLFITPKEKNLYFKKIKTYDDVKCKTVKSENKINDFYRYVTTVSLKGEKLFDMFTWYTYKDRNQNYSKDSYKNMFKLERLLKLKTLIET